MVVCVFATVFVGFPYITFMVVLGWEILFSNKLGSALSNVTQLTWVYPCMSDGLGRIRREFLLLLRVQTPRPRSHLVLGTGTSLGQVSWRTGSLEGCCLFWRLMTIPYRGLMLLVSAKEEAIFFLQIRIVTLVTGLETNSKLGWLRFYCFWL